MKKLSHPVLLIIALLIVYTGQAQRYEIKDIKSFGAKGDGKTNDHNAFEQAAAYFNKRGGNGQLVISKGVYIIGKQTYTKGANGKACYDGEDVIHLTKVHNFSIVGKKGTKLRYQDGMKFGAFDPATGKPYEHGKNYFVNYSYAAIIGHCIYIDSSENVSVSGLEMDGNSNAVILGGVYGDVGVQLPHYGIFISKSRKITVQDLNIHHFALDGICVGNTSGSMPDEISLINSRFEYNGRQGLSWIGGNQLKAVGCKFNHTGQGRFNSAPSAGVDIEAEWGPVRNGVFQKCEFIDNKGCGMVADSGNSGDCSFENCEFQGIQNWSIWTTKPGFSFTGCTIYGSVVHCYDSPNDKDATKFTNCHFEDITPDGKEAYGRFLFESSFRRRISFTNCTFVSNKKKLIWFEAYAKWSPEEKYQFTNCTFTINNTNLANNDWIAVIRGMRYKNCRFIFTKQAYWLNDCCEPFNVDAGGNTKVYPPKKQ